MKRIVAALAVAFHFTVGATAARSEDAAQGAKPAAAAEQKAAAKSPDGCPGGCCEEGKPCPMAEQGGAMPADCPCKKAQKAAQGDASK